MASRPGVGKGADVGTVRVSLARVGQLAALAAIVAVIVRAVGR